jgi:hypothetical protein
MIIPAMYVVCSRVNSGVSLLYILRVQSSGVFDMDCNEEQSYSGDKLKELHKTLLKHLEIRKIELDKIPSVQLENKVKELHTNVRHITQLAMTWFAFFVTTNYLSLGWFAKDVGNVNGIANPVMVYAVAFAFMLQNGLGIVGIWMVKKSARGMAAQVRTYENWLLINKDLLEEISENDVTKKLQIDILECPSIPITLYKPILCFLQVVLLSLIVAWGIIIWLTSSGN